MELKLPSLMMMAVSYIYKNSFVYYMKLRTCVVTFTRKLRFESSVTSYGS